jgi:hypothetical protein
VTGNMKHATGTAPLEDELRERVVALLRAHGDVTVAKLLGISRLAAVRAGAGLAVRPSVANCIEGRIGAAEAEAA